MGYRKSTTNMAVHIVHLYDLNKSQERLCHTLRKEAGRLWTDMVMAHIQSRSGLWLSCRDLEMLFKQGYALHSQSIQAMAQKLAANVDTALQLKKENPEAKLPYRPKAFQTLTWKKDAIRLRDGMLVLSNGRDREPLIVALPQRYQSCQIQQRDVLHKASRQLVGFALEKQVGRIALGDVRECAKGTDKGRLNNQKISQWAHGLFDAYVTYKARFVGIPKDYTPEHYTSKTCPFCDLQLKQAPRGRNFVCPGCGVRCHRDVVGGANLASRSRYGELARVKPQAPMYLRPLLRGRSRRSEPAHVASVQAHEDLSLEALTLTGEEVQ